ncbi:MAG TPA: LuxR C-terminal-related transcriptional regulator [Chitinophagaceae bacterium]|nr:LuxR C-terminal-related transcriptional regulator [Chitinophagaceae bacterium]
MSSFTVNSHRKNLIAKLNVKNTASLVKLAV